jgi:hypothetical protein
MLADPPVGLHRPPSDLLFSNTGQRPARGQRIDAVISQPCQPGAQVSGP